jgi:hypothetical protein
VRFFSVTDKSADGLPEPAHDRMAGRATDDIEAPPRSWLWMPLRIGLVLSVAIHAGIILFALDHAAAPFEALPANAITVDIVPAENVVSRPESAKPIVPSPPFVSASANRDSLSFDGGFRSTARQPDHSAYSVSALANMLHVELTPAGASDGPPSESKLQHSSEAIAAFKAHLQHCWVAPAGAGDAKKLKVVIRVSLDRAGRLTREPTLLEATASAAGPAVVANAMRALRQCEPYNFLPPEKYEDWKILDLRFSRNGVS